MRGTVKHNSVERVRCALLSAGVNPKFLSFDQSTRTAAEAANAIGCNVGEIAKSLIFQSKATNQPILVIARGDRRVNEKKLSRVLGENVGQANPDFVRERTGFAIGGVAPVGHKGKIATFLDRSLGEFSTVWVAAGTPNTVFETTFLELLFLTGGEVIDVH